MIIVNEREVITMRRRKEIKEFIIGLVAFCFAFILLPALLDILNIITQEKQRLLRSAMMWFL